MIVGIDLGTSTSEVACVNREGQVVVIPNSKNETVTPSVVHIKSNGQAIVGSDASEYLFTRPECTFMEMKRKFGTDEKCMAHGRAYSPEDIQAFIIKYLIECAEEYTGDTVTDAVITVPAYFTDIQRKQTITAGKLAGVNIKRIINEPTAAALDYGAQNMSEYEYILVYDFGGGTLDVTVLELYEGVIDVKASCGNNHLGGKDFDELLMRHIGGRRYKAIMSDPKAAMKLKQASTDCKTTLSRKKSAQVRLPLLTEDISIDQTVTLDEFETLIQPLVESTGKQIDGALDDAGLDISDINRVILVGGSTRIPMVREFVEEKVDCICTGADFDNGADFNNDADFDNDAPSDKNADFDSDADFDYSADNIFSPELMVVRGAAYQAAIIDDIIEPERSVVLTDVCPFSLGVKVLCEEGYMVDTLIRRNVTIPYEYKKLYTALHEYQREIEVEIYQGESSSHYENTLIGVLNLDKLPQKHNELAKVEVTFSYDVNGLLSVKVRAIENDNSVETVIDINNNDIPARPQVKLNDWEKAKGSSKFRPLLRKTKKIIDEYIGTDEFIHYDVFQVKDLCDGLKADLILGAAEEAEAKASSIRFFLDCWVD